MNTKLMLLLAVVVVLVGGAQAQSVAASDLSWAFPVPDKTPPAGAAAGHEGAMKHLAGSMKKVVANLSEDDMLAIASYVESVAP